MIAILFFSTVEKRERQGEKEDHCGEERERKRERNVGMCLFHCGKECPSLH